MICTVAAGTVADYYLSEQAAYYTDGREPRGRWYAPNAQFGLVDGQEIDDEQFRVLHGGRGSESEALKLPAARRYTDRVAGYDLTFSSPKSVSVLWALSPSEVRGKIEAAQAQAVRRALDVLNEHAAYARRGKGGVEIEKVELFAAMFQHGEARPTKRKNGALVADPQLHTHVVVLNSAARADGTWGAIDGRPLFAWKMAAGALYRAELASGLRKALGVSLEKIDDAGLFEITGVPKSVREHFSGRRGEIEAIMSTHGRTTSEAQALAAAVTLGSRTGKSHTKEERDDQFRRWRTEAAELGFTPVQARACLGQLPDYQQTILSETIFHQSIAEIPRRLTEYESKFSNRELHAAVAAACVGHGSVDETLSVADHLEETGKTIVIGKDTYGQPIYSTPEMIEIEREVQRLAQVGTEAHRHALSAETVEHAIARTTFSIEQAAAIRAAAIGADIAVIEGAAGAGKSFAMRAVVDLYKSEGYRVVGAATAWKMAKRISDECEIESRATDAWLTAARRGDPFLDDSTILIVDEAGQLSSRQMLAILTAAREAHAKVIFTGDQQQLQAIGAGPGLRIVAQQVGATRTDTILRQREQWARDAAAAFAIGDAKKGFAAFKERSLLCWSEGASETIKSAVGDWKKFTYENPTATTLILARTNTEVRALNAEMREHLRREGRIVGEEVRIVTTSSTRGAAASSLAAGDQIRFGRRYDALGVINGSVGRIAEITPDKPGHARLVVELDERRVEFSTHEISDEAGRVYLAHAYASTVYAAQGATVDVAFVVASDAMKRNDIYVSVSRARGETRLYVDRKAIETTVRSLLPLPARSRAQILQSDLENHLVSAWSRVHQKSCTLDFDDDFSGRNWSDRRRASTPSTIKTRQRKSAREYRLDFPDIERE